MVPQVKIPEAFGFLLTPSRYKIAYGGRDAGKSWSFASVLLTKAASRPLRILCTREFQSSIAESVYRVLIDQIVSLGLSSLFDVQKSVIRGKNGSEFIFKGLRMNISEIKSTEGVDYCWIEEAQMASDESWSVLIPTIRKPNSEIWISFNTGQADDPTYKRFVLNPPPDAIVRKINYDENPFHGAVMEKEREYLLRVDPEAHDHVWLGNPRQISDACIFKGKFEVDVFEAKPDEQLFLGADWGFSNDPTALVRSFIRDNRLYIEYEAFGVGVEMDEIPDLFDSVPGSRDWPILADNSRPETISYIKKKASVSSRPTNGPGASRMESASCGSLKRSSSTSGAGTHWKSSNNIPGKRISKAVRYCRSSYLPTTISSTAYVTVAPTISGPGSMPGLRGAWID
jgi:phage terminase large subunit